MELTKEQMIANIAEKLLPLFEGDGAYNTTLSRLKALESVIGTDKEVSLKTVVEEIDKVKAQNELMVKMIRNQKGGLYSPGMEDMDFNFIRAFTAIRKGNWTGAENEKEIMDAARAKAAQSIGDDSLGGFFVPDQVIPDVIQAIYVKSVMISLDGNGETRISVIDNLTGGNITIPRFDGGLIAYWLGEEDEYAESLAQVGDISMNPKKMGILVKLTDAMMKLGGYGFDALLRRDLIAAAAKKLDWTILNGSGSDHMPRGVFKHPIGVYDAAAGTHYATPALANATVTDWDASTMDFDDVDELSLGLEERNIDLDENTGPISSPRFFAQLKRLKIDNYSGQTTDQAYLGGSPLMTNEALRSLVGNFGKSNQIVSGKPGSVINGATDDTAVAVPVLHGNTREIVLGRWGGVEIMSDNGMGKGFTSDHTYQKLRLLCDVGVRHTESLIVCPNAKIG